MISSALRNRLRGVMVGAAVGDALGMPLEFGPAIPADRLVRQMRAGRLPAGSFTDDTEMALALTESLLAYPHLKPNDLAQRFLAWFLNRPPDVGIHTARVLSLLEGGMSWQKAAQEAQAVNPQNAGNGSLMRNHPVAVADWHKPDRLAEDSMLQSMVTHPHPECGAACVFMNWMIFELMNGEAMETAFQTAIQAANPPSGLAQVMETARGKTRADLPNSGWVRHTVESALWGVFTTNCFEDALISVVNLGADADTAGAVAGALAGALYGLDGIPVAWRNALRGEWPIGSGRILSEADFVELADRLAES